MFLVYYIVYRALLVLRGTRAMQVGMGLAMVFVLYIVAQVLQLVTVLNIMGALISSMILIIVVVFQNDIRRGLQRVGSRAWFGGLVAHSGVQADRRRGRGRHGSGASPHRRADHLRAGREPGRVRRRAQRPRARRAGDARATRVVVHPEGVNKLHDGSVIIRNYRIAKAGVFFPMPEGRVVDDSFGSRHRAALGITEETDAVVVIVSEERGTISFCFNGNIASEPRRRQATHDAGGYLQPQGAQEDRERPPSKPHAIRCSEPMYLVAPLVGRRQLATRRSIRPRAHASCAARANRSSASAHQSCRAGAVPRAPARAAHE